MSGHCTEHFVPYFEEKVRRTIDEHRLIAPGMRVAVAVSGGKDSLTVLTLLHRWGFHVTAILIDEGISGYRDKTIIEARRVCAEHSIPLVIESFKERTGTTLDEALRVKHLHPCTVCGTLRRNILHAAAAGFDVIATGHNADDEAQAVLMNIIKGNTELFTRLGPQSSGGPDTGVAQDLLVTPGRPVGAASAVPPRFVRRIKPLYFCTEKEVAAYAHLKGFVQEFTECPYVGQSYRRVIRDEFNRYAQDRPGTKERLLRRFLRTKELMREQDPPLVRCAQCDQPSSRSPCSACRYRTMLA